MKTINPPPADTLAWLVEYLTRSWMGEDLAKADTVTDVATRLKHIYGRSQTGRWGAGGPRMQCDTACLRIWWNVDRDYGEADGRYSWTVVARWLLAARAPSTPAVAQGSLL